MIESTDTATHLGSLNAGDRSSVWKADFNG